jgi:ABC-2 type transport system permease protein
MLEQLRHIPVFEFKSTEPVTREQGEKWVKNKDVDALIMLPATENGNTLGIVVNKENEKNAAVQAVSGILDKFVQQANLAAAGAKPVFELKTESISSGSADLTSEDFLMTGMIALSVAQGGLFGMVSLVEMRRSGLLKRLRMTPARMGLYGLSEMLVRMVLGIIQIVLLTLIGVFAFGANLHINIFSLIIAFLIGSLAFNAMGYLISSFSKSMEAYMGIANIASFLMMFLSGVFFPIQTLPDWLKPVTHVLPLTYFVNGMRDGMVYASGLASGEFWLGTGLLALWGVVTFALGAWIYKSKSVINAR